MQGSKRLTFQKKTAEQYCSAVFAILGVLNSGLQFFICPKGKLPSSARNRVLTFDANGVEKL